MNESETSGNLTEYLLGGLAEHEREAIEQRSFTDDEFFLELEETEHDLIDKYVRRSLPARERMRFEKAFLTVPGRVRRVDCGAVFSRSESELTGSSSNAWSH